MLLSEHGISWSDFGCSFTVVSDDLSESGRFIPLLFFERVKILPDIEDKGAQCARPVIEAMGFELVDVHYGMEDGLMCLTFYIYSDQGVDIEDCERVSKSIEPVLDENDPTEGGAYCLCVSSPGELPFKTDRDFERNMGKPVQAELKAPVKGKKKKFNGTLLAFDSDKVIIEGKKEKHELKREDIKSIKPYIGF